jgi:site-specific DNA recombinase
MSKPKVILYCRVSTPSQAEHGYSLREQEERLSNYAAQNDLEVLAAIEDAGVSGAAFDRPGLNRVRELVAAGDVSVVLATERDRFAREPAYLYLLRKELEEHGTILKALNDQGDDSPVGELTAGMLDQIAKFYRSTFAAKSMENKRRKAREGAASGSGTPPYGFAYSADRRSLEVSEPEMVVVRRMFSLVAEGATLHSVKLMFEREGIPTPGGGEGWYTMSMYRSIFNDAYFPRTIGELREAGMGEGALATLDPSRRYGLWWYGRNRVKLTPDSERCRRFEENPRSEWIGTPAPDSATPRETIEAARARLKADHRPRKSARHNYELAGMLFCGHCGLRMSSYSTGGAYRYYAPARSGASGVEERARAPQSERRRPSGRS